VLLNPDDIKPNAHSMNEVFSISRSTFYKVPDFQREYKWGKLE